MLLVRSFNASACSALRSVPHLTLGLRPFITGSETSTKKAADLTHSALENLEKEQCLTHVPGVGLKTLERMRALGVQTVEQLRDRVMNELNVDNSPDDVPKILKLKLGVRYVPPNVSGNPIKFFPI